MPKRKEREKNEREILKNKVWSWSLKNVLNWDSSSEPRRLTLDIRLSPLSQRDPPAPQILSHTNAFSDICRKANTWNWCLGAWNTAEASRELVRCSGRKKSNSKPAHLVGMDREKTTRLVPHRILVRARNSLPPIICGFWANLIHSSGSRVTPIAVSLCPNHRVLCSP